VWGDTAFLLLHNSNIYNIVCYIMNKIKKLIYILIIYFAASSMPSYADMASNIAQTHGLPYNYVENALKNAKVNSEIIKFMTTPAESQPWQHYKKIFVNERRIQKGKKFYHKYEKTLERAEREFFVPSKIIAAILGVETNFGNYSPQFNPLDSLYTLATGYPRRSAYFESELGYLLRYAYKNNVKLPDIKSSYAGAIGLPQFMPSNIAKYAVDFDNDGKIDLINSVEDAVGSIANYLKQHGWEYPKPTAVSVANVKQNLLDKWMSISELKRHGVSFPFNLSNHKVKIIKVDETYWATFPNFYTLRKYNSSDKYALSVLLLSTHLR